MTVSHYFNISVIGSYAILFIIIAIVMMFFGKDIIKIVAALAGLVMGSVIGIVIGMLLFPHNILYIILIAIALGLIGIIIGLWILRSTIAWMGFLTFAGIVYYLIGKPSLQTLLNNKNLYPLFYIIIAGIIGYILFYILYDSILILLTVIIGAVLFFISLSFISTDYILTILLSAILGILGFIFQTEKDEKGKKTRIKKIYYNNNTHS
ncbi:MAG: hypothetical protein M1481_06510 [Candidatus Thermoplasmatota archaeon]|nr:hypothetical protein [Candidatus Thermoplasmatota archaeon]